MNLLVFISNALSYCLGLIDMCNFVHFAEQSVYKVSLIDCFLFED